MSEQAVFVAAVIFWASGLLIVYAYVGYPLLIWLLAATSRVPDHDRTTPRTPLPTVSMIVPVHNERPNLEAKLQNLRALDYPPDRFEVWFVSDGSSDGTAELLEAREDAQVHLVKLAVRQGKAAALNAGLERARHDIVVFSDASIALEPLALRAIVGPFHDGNIGCVSGEDPIAGSGGEALYGRYELFIRRQESRVHSIVGASGSFYAQRRSLCEPFPPTLAPDFVSVLRTVERGYRAVSEPSASGSMKAVARAGDEFARKVRTLLRGLSTLARFPHLLNPFRYGLFSFELISHKLVRWLVPFFLLALWASNVVLALAFSAYRAALVLQALFYAFALMGLFGWRVPILELPVRACTYLVVSNAAALAAWFKYLKGVRQEIWVPSQRL